MKASKEQIAEWKAKYGDVYKISVDGKECYLHKPDRKTLSYATSVGMKDPIKFNEIMLNGCWITGDEEIKKDDSLFFAASTQLSELIDTKEAQLEKL